MRRRESKAALLSSLSVIRPEQDRSSSPYASTQCCPVVVVVDYAHAGDAGSKIESIVVLPISSSHQLRAGLPDHLLCFCGVLL